MTVNHDVVGSSPTGGVVKKKEVQAFFLLQEHQKLSSRKDEICPFFFDIQSDKNAFFEVFKVPKTKGIALDQFDEIIGRFQFWVGIGQLKGVVYFLFVLQKCFKDSLKKRMKLLQIVLNEYAEFLRFLIKQDDKIAYR